MRRCHFLEIQFATASIHGGGKRERERERDKESDSEMKDIIRNNHKLKSRLSFSQSQSANEQGTCRGTRKEESQPFPATHA